MDKGCEIDNTGVGDFTVMVTDCDAGVDEDATLTVRITDEGVIVDVFVGNDCIASWGQTAQELADFLLGNE